MARRGDAPTRAEVTDTVDKHAVEMKEKADDIEDVVTDVETERQTLEQLELGGTSEAA